MKVKVIIVDGAVECVLADEEAKKAGLQAEVVNFDPKHGDLELLSKHYETDMTDMDYSLIRCEKNGNLDFHVTHAENTYQGGIRK